jgi:hypothetical protein
MLETRKSKDRAILRDFKFSINGVALWLEIVLILSAVGVPRSPCHPGECEKSPGLRVGVCKYASLQVAVRGE